jgi:hypothetical protein
MTVLTKDLAQRRADQIAAFRAELAELAREGAAPFTAADLERLAAHQEAVLERLAREFDVDRSATERSMSIGMRLASLLGAAALTAAVVSFAYRIWGTMPTGGQVALVTAAPILSVALMLLAGRIEKTRYVASLFAIVACGAFILQTVMLGQLFNLRGSPHVLLLWAAFALAVSIPWRIGVPFAIGVAGLVAYGPSLLLWSRGYAWLSAPERPELLAVSAALAFGALARAPRELAPWGRVVSLVVILAALLWLSSSGAVSLLPFGDGAVELFYQFVAAAAAAALIAIGLRRGLQEVVTLGSLFGGLFLLVRFVDWWWDWMPKYLFFLIVAGVALAWLWGLRLARRRLAAAEAA